MSTVSIEVSDEKSFPGIVADEIVASIQDAIDEQGSCSLVLAGGSTPAGVYRLLGRPPRSQDVDWSCVRLFWGDERWVPKEDNQSNFHMVKETLLSNISIPEENIINVNTSLASPAEAVKDYELTTRKALGFEGAYPSFDIMLLGIGEDGHTASLFPGGAELNEAGMYTVAMRPDSGSERVSVTFPVIKNAKKIFFIVRGEAKADVVQAVLETERPLVDLPA
ncbi:MAG: 6-phosphogluconolactonase [Bdellovibrionales bacterium]|nr:6-phosphogluconolactonase [Bdellovibrionales bacterium]